MRGFRDEAGIHNRSRAVDPADEWEAIVPSDVADLPRKYRALFCTVAGNANLRDFNGNDIVFPLAVGIVPLSPKRVLAGGTNATLVGVW